MIDLTGRTAVITGGSRGIGKAACLLLAEAGANIVLGYHNDHPSARSTVSELHSKGRHAIAVAGDLGRRDSAEELFRRAEEAFGAIDIVVGNAGIWKRGPIDEMTSEAWRETIRANLDSIFLTCQLAVRRMKPRGRGKIILISSTAGQRGEAYYSHYAASKGAIIAFAKSLASELGPSGILVNCVAPGWVETDMSATALGDPEQRRAIEGEIPTGKVASPRDVAGAILFLASDLSSQVQGEVLNVNGGSVLCG